ncbi:hypothetical protein [Mesorhizobium xinjiangense]|uniref:hypothetical protein n=1 Tax=Mesorhizobium xinjiangense TaxID=2678685 RepID=UPI0012EDEFAB|nr:hypothetical protein [Mesorhizobium xinjiangense]
MSVGRVESRLQLFIKFKTNRKEVAYAAFESNTHRGGDRLSSIQLAVFGKKAPAGGGGRRAAAMPCVDTAR